MTNTKALDTIAKAREFANARELATHTMVALSDGYHIVEIGTADSVDFVAVGGEHGRPLEALGRAGYTLLGHGFLRTHASMKSTLRS